MARNWDRSTLKLRTIRSGFGLVAVCLSSHVFASGFALNEQNVTNLGLAYSGTAALADDASTAYYNPAGLTKLGPSQVVLAGFISTGTLNLSPLTATPSVIGLGPMLGGEDNGGGSTAPIGALHLSARLDDRWAIGFSVTQPFGLQTDYHDDSFVRYLATLSKVETYDLSPNLAWKLSKCWSIGAGADAMFVKAKLNANIGTGNPAGDGIFNNTAEGWGYGWHGGILWSPVAGYFARTRVGLNYRSDINVRAEGNAEQQTFVGFFPLTATIQTVHAKVTLPSTLTLSLYQGFGRCFAFTGDVAWTDWSRFSTLRLRYNPGLPSGLDTDTWVRFEDTVRVALGLLATPTDRLSLRVGWAYDQTPTTDEFRTPRIPDASRIWFALGGGYKFTNCFKLDVGYAYIHFKDVELNSIAPFRAQTTVPISAATLTGTYDNSQAHVIGMQIRYDFV